MNPEIATGIVTPFFANGIIGSVCVALAFFILKLWAEMKSERAAHKIELAAKDALINELYEARVSEARIGYDIIKTNDKTQAAFLSAITGRSLT